MNQVSLTFWITVVIALVPSTVSAQGCCGLGSSSISGSFGSIPQRSLRLSVAADYAASGRQYTISSVSTDPSKRFVERAESRITVGYGITDRLFMDISGGILYREKSYSFTRYTGLGTTTQNAFLSNWGMTDGAISTGFTIVPLTVLTKTNLTAGLVLGMPWGRSDAEYRGVLVPRDMQAGSGAWSTGLFLHLYRAFPAQKMGVSASVSPKIKFAAADDYNLGDELSFSLGAVAGPWHNLKASLGLSSRIADTDVSMASDLDSNGNEFSFQTVRTGTGGWWLDATPGLEWQPTSAWSLTLSGELPVWRRVNGTQLTKAYTIRLATSVVLGGKKETPHINAL